MSEGLFSVSFICTKNKLKLLVPALLTSEITELVIIAGVTNGTSELIIQSPGELTEAMLEAERERVKTLEIENQELRRNPNHLSLLGVVNIALAKIPVGKKFHVKQIKQALKAYGFSNTSSAPTLTEFKRAGYIQLVERGTYIRTEKALPDNPNQLRRVHRKSNFQSSAH
jgi:hypothetical protein